VSPELGLPDAVPVILFLGRIHRLKGVDRLLRAFARIAPHHADAHLVIAGRDDGALPDLRRLASALGVEARVRFPGPIYGDARYNAYRRADLFAITPTHFEETSLASLEAASVGTPLLLGGEAEAPFLDEYAAGWTVEPGSDVAAVLDLALSGDLVTAGANASRMIQERHGWDAVGKQLAEILGGLR
jgi:glycosyltransferase involved in cell wall biosynthesis